MSWVAKQDSPRRRHGRVGYVWDTCPQGAAEAPCGRWSMGLVLTSSTPSASTTRDQVLGLSTKGSPKLFWGTVTKAGSVLGAKTICLVCSVPGAGGMRGCEGTGMENLGLQIGGYVQRSSSVVQRGVLGSCSLGAVIADAPQSHTVP